MEDHMEFRPRGKGVMLVRIMSYGNQCPVGVLTNIEEQETVPFFGLMSLLLRMESLMNQSNYPQRNAEPRFFRMVRPKEMEETIPVLHEETLAIFQIQVLFRQHASWQGRLIWVDQKMEAQFRSVLELAQLIDNALSNSVGESDER